MLNGNNINRFNKIIVIDVDKYINILKNLPEGFSGNYYGFRGDDNQNMGLLGESF